jgi:maleylacetate reductase
MNPYVGAIGARPRNPAEHCMSPTFTYDTRWPRIVFGAGAIDRLPDEVDRLRSTRVLVVTTPGRADAAEEVRRRLGNRLAGNCAVARMHVPAASLEAGLEAVRDARADLVVAFGGGSAIGLAKALALRGGPGYLAVPTTYSGSEMTPIWGTSDGGRKTTGRDARVVPRAIVYDPALTLSLPARVVGPSGMNAIAHAVEALYAPDVGPLTTAIAEEAIRSLGGALPGIARDPLDLQARSMALAGAWLAGGALAAARMGLHHRICHTLGGSFDLPHAETHAVVLPHVVAYNRPAAGAAMERVARALFAVEPVAALHGLNRELGCPVTLRQIGMRDEDLDEAAALVVETPYPNPRPFTRESVRELLAAAQGES